MGKNDTDTQRIHTAIVRLTKGSFKTFNILLLLLALTLCAG